MRLGLGLGLVSVGLDWSDSGLDSLVSIAPIAVGLGLGSAIGKKGDAMGIGGTGGVGGASGGGVGSDGAAGIGIGTGAVGIGIGTGTGWCKWDWLVGLE